jgi:hypothetical protein
MSLRSTFQVLLCLLSGSCWGLALRYAGTSDPQAKSVLLKHLRFLQWYSLSPLFPFPLQRHLTPVSLRDGVSPPWDSVEFAYPQEFWHQELESMKFLTKVQRQKHLKSRMKRLLLSAADKASRPILEMCLTLMSLSVSMICAGSGDLDVLRILRALLSKVEDVAFGTHMGLSMAVGFLFLQQGKASLKRDDVSIASLILATAPRYPVLTKDNQSHLQALRHLYVLAVEERCLQAIDVDTGSSTPLDVEVALHSGKTMILRIPTLLPELSSIKYVRSLSINHFPASIGMTPTRVESQCPQLIPCQCPHQPTVSSPSQLSHLSTNLFIKKLPREESTTTTEHFNLFSTKFFDSQNSPCQLAHRVLVESQSLNSILSGGICHWSHSLCLEVNLLRIVLTTFPFIRGDPKELSKTTSSVQDYSLPELLCAADTSLSMECISLLQETNKRILFTKLLLDFADQLPLSDDHTDTARVAYAFGLTAIDSRHGELSSIVDSLVHELEEEAQEGATGDPQKLMSLVNSVGLLGRKTSPS